jgi:hypothetical protein
VARLTSRFDPRSVRLVDRVQQRRPTSQEYFDRSLLALLQTIHGFSTTKPFRVRHLRWPHIKGQPTCCLPANGL